MKSKPSIKSLIVESHKFAMENAALAIHFAMPLLIPLVALILLINIGGYFWDGFGLLNLAAFYFWGCFVLAWHRSFLLTPRSEHIVNPYALKPGEGKFIASIFGLWLAPIVVGFVGGLIMGLGTGIAKTAAMPFIALLAILIGGGLFIAGMLVVLRWFFILPARSVNAPVSLKEAKQISRGLLWRFIAAGSLVFLGIFLALFPVLFTMYLMLGRFVGVDSLAFAIGETILLHIPSIPVTFYILAMNVGILSRLYQWAVQERG